MTLLLAGCGLNSDKMSEQDDSTSSKSPISFTSSPYDVPDMDLPYTKYNPIKNKRYAITWANWLTGTVEEDADMVEYWNKLFNVDITVLNIDSSKYSEYINLVVAGGVTPDFFRLPDGYAAFQQYHENELLAEIPEEVFAKLGAGFYSLYMKEVPEALIFGIIDGKRYGIPEYKYHSRFSSTVAARGDWLSNIGVKNHPRTLEEFEDLIYRFTFNDPDGNGLNDTYGISSSMLDAVFGAFGYLPYNWQEKDGKLVYGGIQPEMADALAVLSKWYTDGVIDPEFVTGENKGGAITLPHAFLNGRIGFSALGEYYKWSPVDPIGETYAALQDANPKAAENLVFLNPPEGPEGKKGLLKFNVISETYYGFGSQLDQEPDKMGRILTMLDYMYKSYENHNLIRYGIEDVHWQFINGMPTFMLEYEDPLVQAREGIGNTFRIVNSYEYYRKLTPLRNQWAEGLHLDEIGYCNELLTSLPASTKHESELRSLQQEAYIGMQTGDLPLSSFDNFVTIWLEKGGEEWVAEANEWYAGLKSKLNQN